MLHRLLAMLTAFIAIPDDDPERGDVPGWVMVTLMTAGLVILIWALAGEALVNLFQTAMDRILGA